jgi:general secretion pathway protein C
LLSGQWIGLSLRLMPWLNALFILLLAYALAGTSWRLWPSADSTIPLLSVAVTPLSTAVAGASGLDSVAALHLFGEANAPKSAPVPSVIDAPETRLSLTLKGIVAVSGGAQGRALIAEGSAAERVYKVGDALSGGALLHEVLADKVILKRGDHFETLTLPRERIDLSGTAPAGDARASSGTRGTSTRSAGGAVSEQLRTLRDTIADDPQQAFNLVRAQPVMEGGAVKGYRVNPGKQRQLFQGTGLRAGDVVTRVNGVALGDPAQMATLFAQFKSANRFDLMVERGGRETSLTIDLGK